MNGAFFLQSRSAVNKIFVASAIFLCDTLPVEAEPATEPVASTEDDDDAAADLISTLSPQQCHALYLALKQKYEEEPEAPEDFTAPEDVPYDADMVP